MQALAVGLPRQGVYEQSKQAFEDVVQHLDSEEARLMTHSELERELEKRGRELMRTLLQEHLDRRGLGGSEEPVEGIDGARRTQVHLHKRKLETVFGTVTVNRTGYSRQGRESLHPLDAELNLPEERYSLELRCRAAEEAAKSSFDETLASIGKTTGGHVPKRQTEQLAMRAARDFDAFYEMRQIDATRQVSAGSILVMSVDGKGVVMRPEDLREKTREAAMAREHKMTTRLSKGEKKNAKRMATVAAVYTIEPMVRQPEHIIASRSQGAADPPRPRPEQKRVWASIEKTPEEVIEQAFQEAGSRDPAGEKPWLALVDGNKKQIRILRRIAKKKGVNLTIIVDVVHVLEYLWDAGRVFCPQSGPELEAWVQTRLLNILRGKAAYVAGGLRRSATLRNLDAKTRKPVDVCAGYVLNHTPYLKYDVYLAQGMPIATGVIEGACRHLVKDRMEVTGARWSLAGAEAVLRLRALRSSRDFDAYWTFHEAQEYRRNHQNLYANGIVPSTVPPPRPRRRPRLKTVK
jgi:hypothetical protein